MTAVTISASLVLLSLGYAVDSTGTALNIFCVQSLCMFFRSYSFLEIVFRCSKTKKRRIVITR